VLSEQVDKINYHLERYPDSSLVLIENLKKVKISDDIKALYIQYYKGVYFQKIHKNDDALKTFNHIDSLISKKKYPQLYLKNKIRLSVIHQFSEANSESNFVQLLKYADSLNDIKSRVKIQRQLAKLYKKDSLVIAQKIYQSIINLIKDKPKFEKELAYTYADFGKFYFDSKNFDPNNKHEKAITYYQKALDLSEKNGLLNLYYNTKIKLENIKPTREEFKNKTIDYAKKWLVSNKEAFNYFKNSKDFKGQVNALFYLGNSKRWLGDVKAAITFWEKGFEISKQNNFKSGQIRMSNYIILFSIRIKDFDKAEIYALYLQNNVVNTKNYRAWRDAEDRLSYLYSAKGDYKKALKHNVKYWILRDSIANRNEIIKLNELETKYQTKQKAQEITLLKSQNDLIEQQKRTQKYLFFTGLILSSFIGLFFYFQYRNRKKLTQKLQKLDAAKSTLFANISHEFRTPLTLISGPIQSLLKSEKLSDNEKSNLTIMHRNSDRLLDLTNQLLDISKIESGVLKLRISNRDITQFVSVLLESFNFSAQQKGITFKTSISNSAKDAWFDKDFIEKIVVNLTNNAIKYTPENGEVDCQVSVENGQFNFEIKNTGIGLTKEDTKKIFERFYQKNTAKQGAGIGLSLVKELVSLHKGIISVESTPNAWTIFTIKIPIEKAFYDEQDIISIDEIVKSDLENSTDEITITAEQPILLIVDDSKDIRDYISTIFQSTYTILLAKNGEEGIDLAFEHIPDIIISDVMMPLKNGIELCHTLKNDERTSHIPIVLLTAKTGEVSELEAVKSGADDYITKPFNENILISKIKNRIRIRQKLQERYSQEVILKPTDISLNSCDTQFLNRVQEEIDKNIIEASYSIEDFSKAVGMSRMQLHRKLKALFGMSTTEFIRSQRLKLAAELLKQSDVNVSQIGYSVGFNDHAYFSKRFKEFYGCSPTDYARNINQK
jgi:signal transduction histidine kinase/DNA-binding response OmpR family regulator